MTEPTAPSPEALPGTYTKKKDAIIALRALAKHTGHKLVVPNHGSTNITLRCKGFSTTGCTFVIMTRRKVIRCGSYAHMLDLSCQRP
eukprot:SAG25_NODE_2154_length_1890_cov_1.211614_3_plen_87_part_00